MVPPLSCLRAGFGLASQIAQAEEKKTFIESTRPRKWNTSSILWWNVIDGWPQFSDAVVDYHIDHTGGVQELRQACGPLPVLDGCLFASERYCLITGFPIDGHSARWLSERLVR